MSFSCAGQQLKYTELPHTDKCAQTICKLPPLHLLLLCISEQNGAFDDACLLEKGSN